jgi:heat shock protein HslJ
MRLRVSGAVSASVLVIVVVGCTGSDTSGGELAGVTWTVTSLPGNTIPAGLRIDATFRDGTIEGSDGCNVYDGPYSLTGDGGIDFRGLGGTDIGCAPVVADAGAAYASALDRAASYEVDDETLTLLDEDGAEVVRFKANAAPPITGLTWQAFGYRDGPVDDKQAVVSPLEGSTITAEFGADGTMSGSSGCNTYTADYEVSGNAFSITALVSTERACEPPLMRQERAYVDALGSVERWKFSGPAFQLLNETGTVEATYAPA